MLPSRNKICWLASGLMLVLAVVPAVFGHAKLLRSEPSAKATLKEPPKTVVLWFSEELESQFSTIVVTSQNGKHVDNNDVSLAEGNRKLQISLEDLPSGTYTVDWKALSTDEHTMKGKFTFTVAPKVATAQTSPSPQSAASLGQPTPILSLVTAEKSESMEVSGSSWTQSLVRWFEYLATMMLFGGFAFYLFVLKPAFRQQGSTQTHNAPISTEGARRLALFSGAGIALLASASFAELILQASTVFDKSISESLSPTLLRELITQTGFGTFWLLLVGAMVVLLLIVIFIFRQTREESTSGFLWWAGLAASALLLVAPTLTGHAAVAAKQYPFAKTNDWLHLAAAGVWVGGLFHLALTLPKAISTLKSQQRLRVLHRVIPLFTRLASVSTILIVLTGVYNSWMHVDKLGELRSTSYGRTLSLKVLLVIPMLVLGGVNTLILHPRTSRLIENEDGDLKASANVDQSFLRSVRIEALLGVAVLFVAAILVFEQPAREHPPNEAASGSTVLRVQK